MRRPKVEQSKKNRSTKKVLDFLHGTVPKAPTTAPITGELEPEEEEDEDELALAPLLKGPAKTRIY